MTVVKCVLARTTVGMIDAMMAGKQPAINDTKTYNNGVKVVPSYLLKPVSMVELLKVVQDAAKAHDASVSATR